MIRCARSSASRHPAPNDPALSRCLIIGCGCRGQALAKVLVADGHLVRGTTRDPARLEAIAAAGAEPVTADPDRVSTLMESLRGVSVVAFLLGSAAGSPGELEALHGPRLEMLLTKLVDTTARGVVYEAAGSVDRVVLAGGAERVQAFAGRSHASCELLAIRPDPVDAWLQAARNAFQRVLGAG